MMSQVRLRLLFPALAAALSACGYQAAGEPVQPLRDPPGFGAGDFVVFTATKDLATRTDLYLARLDGSEAFRLNGELAPGGNVRFSSISPDGSRIAYAAEQRFVPEKELFTSRPDGSDNAVVSGPMVPGGGVVDFRWLPDATGLAYRADQVADGRFELVVAAPGGGPADAQISGPLADGGDVFAFSAR